MAPQDGISRFWRELDGRLARLEKSESWLARRLNLPVQTVASWKQRNQFRRACLPQLGEVLHWEGLNQELAAHLGVELIEGKAPARVDTHPTEDMLRGSTASIVSPKKSSHATPATRYGCCKPLEKLLLCVLSPDQYALRVREHSGWPRALAVAIARAICQGALCLYIRPNEEGVSYLPRHMGFWRAGLSKSCGGRDHRFPCSAHELDGQGRDSRDSPA